MSVVCSEISGVCLGVAGVQDGNCPVHPTSLSGVHYGVTPGGPWHPSPSDDTQRHPLSPSSSKEATQPPPLGPEEPARFLRDYFLGLPMAHDLDLYAGLPKSASLAGLAPIPPPSGWMELPQLQWRSGSPPFPQAAGGVCFRGLIVWALQWLLSLCMSTGACPT